jgi:alpha-beta hydrolase superfamily lysophospholipase
MQDMVIEIVVITFITTDRKPELILCGHSLGAGVAVLLAMVKITKL